MDKMEFSKNQIPQISQNLLFKILKIKRGNAMVLAFSGDLGAGKTTLTQEIALQFGIKENVVSPTFVIMKIYKISSSSKYYSHFKKLIHIDAYRIEKEEELSYLGWDEIISDKDNLVIIEWPEKVKKIIPKSAINIFLSHIDEETRAIRY